MRNVCSMVLLGVLASCVSGPGRRMGAEDLVAMKKAGLAESEIVRAVEAEGVDLTLTDDDIIRLVESGFSTEGVNALLERARDVKVSGHH